MREVVAVGSDCGAMVVVLVVVIEVFAVVWWCGFGVVVWLPRGVGRTQHK